MMMGRSLHFTKNTALQTSRFSVCIPVLPVFVGGLPGELPLGSYVPVVTNTRVN